MKVNRPDEFIWPVDWEFHLSWRFNGFAIGVDRSQGPFRGFPPRKTTPRDLCEATVICETVLELDPRDKLATSRSKVSAGGGDAVPEETEAVDNASVGPILRGRERI